MKRLFKAIDVHFNKITKQDYDGVILITGDEGTGKSNLELHIIEYWYNKLNGTVTEDDIKHICLDVKQFTEDLRDCIKFEATAYDEAADISNKRSMSKLNVLLSQTYQIIRGDNLLTLLVLPSVFDLDGFFTKRRARGLIYVNKRGELRYYSKRRLRKIIALNQNRILKTVNVVAPTFVDTFPKYKGILLDKYLEKKQEKMKNIRKNLANEIDKSTKTDERKELIYNIYNKLGATKTADIVGLSRQQVHNIVSSVKG